MAYMLTLSDSDFLHGRSNVPRISYSPILPPIQIRLQLTQQAVLVFHLIAFSYSSWLDWLQINFV
jgi:hypothetical protein